MLDQNTDRMWFVIGALVVGAGIILLANKTMPEVFASVADSFEKATGKATDVVDDFDVFGATPTRSEFNGFTFYFPEDSGTWEYSGISQLSSDYEYFSLAFPHKAATNPNAEVYIEDVFEKANTEYTVTYNAHRHGFGPIDYELYVGNTYVGTFNAGTVEKTYSFTVTSPDNLEDGNHLSIRSTYDIGSNAFWLSQLSITEK